MSHSRDALPSPSDNAPTPPPAEAEPSVNPDGASPSVTTTDSNGDAETEDTETGRSAEGTGTEDVKAEDTGNGPSAEDTETGHSAEEDEIDRSKFVREGDVLIALPSSGLHSNGFSLARKVIAELGLKFDDKVDGRALIDVLLEPTRIYVADFLNLKDKIHALAHITGGGIVENLPRVFPQGLGGKI